MVGCINTVAIYIYAFGYMVVFGVKKNMKEKMDRMTDSFAVCPS